MNEIEEYMEQVKGVFMQPVVEALDDSDSIDSLRDYLNVYSPHKIYNAMVAGANDFLTSFDEYTSKNVVAGATYVFSELKEKVEQLEEVWDVLDEYERTKILNLVSEGAFSDETLFGVALGSAIWPGIGTLVGAFLGGRAAGKRIQNQLDNIMEYYSNGIQNFIQIYCQSIEKIIKIFFAENIEAQEEKKRIKSSSGSNYLDELERLSCLKRDGVITEEEFKKLKGKIIS